MSLSYLLESQGKNSQKHKSLFIERNIRIVNAALKLQCITNLMLHQVVFLLMISLRDFFLLFLIFTHIFFFPNSEVPMRVSCAQQTTLNELEEVLDEFKYKNEI